MEILSELEPEPRGVYTGAIGHVPPDGNASFNVAIRTAVIDLARGHVRVRRRQRHRLGLGRRRRVRRVPAEGRGYWAAPPATFELLETLRWTPDERILPARSPSRPAARHRPRTSSSLVAMTQSRERCLDGASRRRAAALRVRLLVARGRPVQGRTRAARRAASDGAAPGHRRRASRSERLSGCITRRRTETCTSRRARRRRGIDESCLWNRSGQVTEATTANVVVEVDGARVTPPVACGLLAGTFRAELLARGEIQERVVTLDDLRARTAHLVDQFGSRMARGNRRSSVQ